MFPDAPLCCVMAVLSLLCEVIVIQSHFDRRKRLRGVKCLSQYHTALKWVAESQVCPAFPTKPQYI